MPSHEEQYAALTLGAGCVDVSDRTQLEVTGQDRVTFLHNMCTQDVRKLEPNTGGEAFFTDAKGHVLAFVDLFVTPTSIVIDTVAGQGTAITSHLDRYIIREDVELASRNADWVELLVAGEHAVELLDPLTEDKLPDAPWNHLADRIAGRDVFVRRLTLAGPNSLGIVCTKADLPDITAALVAAGVVACDQAALETVRVEQRTPYFGRDVTDRNLPQEVDRNPTAISFNKGCYIGQETVARLDALGHVNKLLVAVKFQSADVPATGTVLQAEGKDVGEVTSAVFSPHYGAALALAYVRHAHSASGSRLDSAASEAVVV